MIKTILQLDRNTSIKLRILIHFLLVTIISMSLTYIITYNSFESEIKKTYFEKLTSIREIKKTQIQEYFNTLQEDISILANMQYMPIAYKELTTSFLNNKHKSIVNKYDVLLKRYNNKKHLYDILIIDLKSDNIIYTATKEADYKTNITQGKYQNTHLNKLYQNVKKSKNNNIIKIIDFQAYSPSGNKPAAFMATKILDYNNKPIAVLVFQISTEKINDIMTGKQNWKKEGFGDTGECYIVSNDCTMRNDSRFFLEDKRNYIKRIKNIGANKNTINNIKSYNTTVLYQKINDNICTNIFNGQNHKGIIKDYRGVEVLSADTPLLIDDLNWTILSEIDKEEAFGYIHNIKKNIVIILLIMIVFITIITILFSKTITQPLDLLTNAIKNLGTGDLSKRVDIKYNNELGVLADCFNKSLDELEKMNDSVEYFAKLSVTDSLTQIYNRIKLHSELDIEIKRYTRTQSKLSLVMFDIDHFKKINDTYGHDVGDVTLIDLVKLVQKNIRETDIFVRWGGEEFMLLLIDTDLENAKLMTEKIRKKIELFSFKEIDRLTCSFGITQLNNKDTKESIIKRVDEVLYDAKNNGRNRIESK
jgi:diguanylate cyclase (GGDEF)-like protein